MFRNKLIIGAAALLAAVGLLVFWAFWPKGAATPDAPDPDAVVVDTLRSFDPADPLSFLRIQDIIDLGEAGFAPLLTLADSGQAANQWAAVIGLVALRRGKDEPAGVAQALRVLSQSGYLTVRLHAAASHARFGDWSGAPIFLDALNRSEIMSYMDPPTPVAVFANRALESLSGQDFGYDEAVGEAARQAAIIQWQQWLVAKQNTTDL